jgi:hypothetical protein
VQYETEVARLLEAEEAGLDDQHDALNQKPQVPTSVAPVAAMPQARLVAPTTNTSLRAYFELVLQSLRVTDGAAAVELMLNSERVFRDLIEAIAAQKIG